MEILICNECNHSLREDDRDFDFPGKGEIMYECDNCGASYYASIRFGKLYKFYKSSVMIEGEWFEIPPRYEVITQRVIERTEGGVK